MEHPHSSGVSSFQYLPSKGHTDLPKQLSAGVKCLLFSGCQSILNSPTVLSEMPIFGQFFMWVFRNGFLSAQLHVTMDYAGSKGLVKIQKEIPKLFVCIWFSVAVTWQGLAGIRADAVKMQWSLVTFPYSGVHTHSHTSPNFFVSHSIPNALGGEHPVFSPVHGLPGQIPVLPVKRPPVHLGINGSELSSFTGMRSQVEAWGVFDNGLWK